MKKDFVIIIILDKDEIKRLEFDQTGKHVLYNKDYLILPYDLTKKDRFVKDLSQRGLYKRRAILLKSPYDDENYQEVAEAQLAFAIEKYIHFSMFCNLLGAKEVLIEQIEEKSNRGEAKYNVKANSLETRGELTVENSHIGLLKSRLQIHDIYSGGDPQLEKAEDLLKKTRLWGDNSIRNLVEIRRSPNLIKSRELNINLSTESKHMLRGIGKIEFPLYLSDIQGQLEHSLEESINLIVNVSIKF